LRPDNFKAAGADRRRDGSRRQGPVVVQRARVVDRAGNRCAL